MEIADVFAVNKADRPGAENIIAELNMILDIKRRPSDWELPVVATVAIANKNTDELLAGISSHINYKKKTGQFETHRRNQIKKKIQKILQFHINNIVRAKLLNIVNLDQIVSDIYDGKADPYSASQELLELSDLSLSAS